MRLGRVTEGWKEECSDETAATSGFCFEAGAMARAEMGVGVGKSDGVTASREWMEDGGCHSTAPPPARWDEAESASSRGFANNLHGVRTTGWRVHFADRSKIHGPGPWIREGYAWAQFLPMPKAQIWLLGLTDIVGPNLCLCGRSLIRWLCTSDEKTDE